MACLLGVAVAAAAGCSRPAAALQDWSASAWQSTVGGAVGSEAGGPARPPVADRASPKAHKLAEAAMSQVGRTVSYDPAYVQLAYPGGDVPIAKGVCTDVLVRAFRSVGLDLQVAVHEDMSRHFSAYPQKWGLPKPDPNIDHRRVPNLQTYFKRQGKAVRVTASGADYWPGDVVTWTVAGLPHTGIVSTQRSADGQRFCIAHNIGAGTQIEDMLFGYKITGHYRVY
jgi:uncharacterized protein YijF (DUF1287 family)